MGKGLEVDRGGAGKKVEGMNSPEPERSAMVSEKGCDECSKGEEVGIVAVGGDLIGSELSAGYSVGARTGW